MIELPTDIWREIISMSKMSVKDKIDEVGTIKELIEVDRYITNKINQSIEDFKAQFKTFDILEYFNKEEDRTIYLLYAYQEQPRSRYINCFEVTPSQYYTLCGKFIPKDMHKMVDITDKNIKIHKLKKDIDDERKLIKVNANDTFIYNTRLCDYNNYNIYLTSEKESYDYYSGCCKYLISRAKKITEKKIYTECGRIIDRKFVVKSYGDYDDNNNNNNKNEKLIEYLNAIKHEHFK